MKLILVSKDTNKEFIYKMHKQRMHLSIKETNQSNRGTRFKWTFLQRRHGGGHEGHEKMLSIYKY